MWVSVDDFGLSRAINRELLGLAERGVVTAVSVMVHRDASTELLDELRALPLRLGLHATFTGGLPLVTALGRLPPAWWSLAPRTLIESQLALLLAELRRQAERFVELVGRIDFVNAHEHVHLLPSLWPAIVELVRAREIAAVRVPAWPPAWASGRESGLACVAALARVRAPLPAGTLATEPLGVLRAGRLDAPQIRSLLARHRAHAELPLRALELCCHPVTLQGRTPEAALLERGTIDRIIDELGFVRERGERP